MALRGGAGGTPDSTPPCARTRTALRELLVAVAPSYINNSDETALKASVYAGFKKIFWENPRKKSIFWENPRNLYSVRGFKNWENPRKF